MIRRFNLALAVASVVPIVAFSAAPAFAADTAPGHGTTLTLSVPNGNHSVAIQFVLYPPGPCLPGNRAICENLGGLVEINLYPPGPCDVDCPAPPIDTAP
jgi:hypothetical protein